MKKKSIFLLGAVFIYAGSSLAQNGSPIINTGEQPATKQTQIIDAKPPYFQNGEKVLNILWSEDFTSATNGAGAIAFNTTNGDYTRSLDDGSFWSQSNNANTPLGGPMGLQGRYMLWNSYTPNSNESTGFSTTNVIGAIQTPTIDLSGAADNNVKLSFVTASMYCCHPQQFPWQVAVSTDNGATFSAPMTLDFGVGRNVSTAIIASPLPVNIDLSAYLDSDPMLNNEVVLQFIWKGNEQFNYTSGGFQMNTHYYWGIDNIEIYETPQYDLALDMGWLGDIVEDYEISEVPQTMAGNLIVQAKMTNLGLTVAPVSRVNVSILLGATEVATATGGTFYHNFTSGNVDTITFETGINLSTLAVGTYTVRFTVDLGDDDDANTTNDVYNRTLRITNNTMATFNQDMPRQRTSVGYFYSGAPTTTSSYMLFGNIFTIDQNVQLHGVEMAGATGTANLPVYMNQDLDLYIFRVTEEFQNPEFVNGPYRYSVTPNKLGNATSRFVYNMHQPDFTGGGVDGPTALLAGERYIVGFEHQGGPSTHFFCWGTARDHDNSNRGRDDEQWWLFPEEPIIALNFDQSLTIQGVDLIENSFQTYPNPAQENLTVVFALITDTDVALEITDLSGKVVEKLLLGTLNQGHNKVDLSTTNLSNGMYHITIVTHNGKMTKKFVVQK
jgi:hypothetical protein